MNRIETVYLDTETTGFSATKDDVLQIGIVDGSGDTLLDTLCSPVRKSAWPHAMEVNNITPAMVRGKPPWLLILPSVIDLCRGKKVVIYNKSFDLKFCPGLEEAAESVECCMMRFAKHYGKRKKLVEAADITGFDWGSLEAHNATSDCLATRHVWQYLENLDA